MKKMVAILVALVLPATGAEAQTSAEGVAYAKYFGIVVPLVFVG